MSMLTITIANNCDLKTDLYVTSLQTKFQCEKQSGCCIECFLLFNHCYSFMYISSDTTIN